MTLTKRYEKVRNEMAKMVAEMQEAVKLTDDIEQKVSIKNATKRIIFLKTEFMKNYFAVEDASTIRERKD